MTRYAAYFVPQFDSALWTFGCRAIGYDSGNGQDVALHDHAFYRHDDIETWTADPRRYGFHGTLKPPFVLADGRSVDELEAAASEFAAQRTPFSVDKLAVRVLGSFLALVPEPGSPELAELAGSCIEFFEPFRAALSDTDRARRLGSPLSERQIAYLDKWGYPYVFDEFRFHMTLTGRLSGETKTDALAALTELYAPIAAGAGFDSICICEQPDRNARFRVRRRFEFGSRRARPAD